MTTWGEEIGGTAAARPGRGEGRREGGMEGEEPGGSGAQPWPPRVCWVCRLGQAPGCSSASPPLPACRSGSGAGAQPWAPVGGPHSRQPGPACPHCSLGSGGCWLAKPPLAWKTQPSPGWELGKWLQAGSSVFTSAQEFAWRDNQLSPQDLAHYNNIKIKWDIETAVLKLLKGSEQM